MEELKNLQREPNNNNNITTLQIIYTTIIYYPPLQLVQVRQPIHSTIIITTTTLHQIQIHHRPRSIHSITTTTMFPRSLCPKYPYPHPCPLPSRPRRRHPIRIIRTVRRLFNHRVACNRTKSNKLTRESWSRLRRSLNKGESSWG